MFTASAMPLAVEVQTNVPDVVPGANPVAVEHIKVYGKVLEGKPSVSEFDHQQSDSTAPACIHPELGLGRLPQPL